MLNINKSIVVLFLVLAMGLASVQTSRAFDIDGARPGMSFNDVKDILKVTKLVKKEELRHYYMMDARTENSSSGESRHYDIAVCKKDQTVDLIRKFLVPTSKNFIQLNDQLIKAYGQPTDISTSLYESSYSPLYIMNTVWKNHGDVTVLSFTYSGEKEPGQLKVGIGTGYFCNP